MRHLLIIFLVSQVLFGVEVVQWLVETPEVVSNEVTFCPPGRLPHFDHGFAFLKGQLGLVMGEPVECEHFDAEGNAFQRTTTGQAFYDKASNTPMFSRGNRHWAWTSSGLKQWVSEADATPLESSLHLPSASVTSSAAATASVRVVSYNILFGAGVDPDWEQAAANLSPFAYPGNRLDKILAIIQAANPDIVGIQEAANWDSGSPSPVQQVAGQLGMNYFLAQTDNDLNLVLFTRYEIVNAENLSLQIGNVGSLRADLAIPGGQILHVFVVHLDPFSAETRVQELELLTQKMAPYLSSPTLLLGDMNYYCLDDPQQCQEYRVLNQAGWQLALAGQYKLDQIWLSPSLAQQVEPIAFPNASFAISDHLPVGAVLNMLPIP